jgi:3-hydroxyisobutyrate dehydrogenase-like beta-hydroxyacid dehydrogenase
VSKEIGFIGLGNMGLRIVELLLEDGFDVVVWARRPQSIAPLQGRVTVADSPAQLGSTVSLVGVCVWDEHDVEEVLLGNAGVFGGLASGGIVMIHSTIAPGACSRIAEQAAEVGVAVLDVPVSVGPNAPKVLALVGGDSEVVEKARPALKAFSEPAVHLGPLGSGQIAKLMNNTLQAATVGIGFEAVDAGVGLGLDRDALLAALSVASSGGTWTGLLRRRWDTADVAVGEGRTNEWATKDVGLATRVIEERLDAPPTGLLRAAQLGASILS